MTKKLMITIIVLGSVVLVLAFIFMSVNNFKLTTVEPLNGQAVGPESAEVKFNFNEPLSPTANNSILVSVVPEIDFLFKTEEATVTVVLRDLLISNSTTYTVTISNIVSDSGKTIDEVATSLNIEFGNEAVSLLSALPFSGNGFSIDKLSGAVFVVYADNSAALVQAKNKLEASGFGLNKFVVSEVLLNQKDPSAGQDFGFYD